MKNLFNITTINILSYKLFASLNLLRLKSDKSNKLRKGPSTKMDITPEIESILKDIGYNYTDGKLININKIPILENKTSSKLKVLKEEKGLKLTDIVSSPIIITQQLYRTRVHLDKNTFGIPVQVTQNNKLYHLYKYINTNFVSVDAINDLRLFNKEIESYIIPGKSYIIRYRLAFMEGNFSTTQWKSTGYLYVGSFEVNLDYHLWNLLRTFYIIIHETYLTNELEFNPHTKILEVSLDYKVITTPPFKLSNYLRNLGKSRKDIIENIEEKSSYDIYIDKDISKVLLDKRLIDAIDYRAEIDTLKTERENVKLESERLKVLSSQLELKKDDNQLILELILQRLSDQTSLIEDLRSQLRKESKDK